MVLFYPDFCVNWELSCSFHLFFLGQPPLPSLDGTIFCVLKGPARGSETGWMSVGVLSESGTGLLDREEGDGVEQG